VVEVFISILCLTRMDIAVSVALEVITSDRDHKTNTDTILPQPEEAVSCIANVIP
jgi:hypothetical protein